MLQAFHGNPLERCPAVRCIPLLAVVHGGSHQPAGLQQLLLNRAGSAFSLLITGDLQIEREQRGSRQLRMNLLFLPVIVGIPVLFAVPQIAVDRRLALLRAIGVLLRQIALVVHLVAFRQGLLQMEQQAVQINRRQLGGADRRQVMCIGKPARTEIPARRRTGTQLAIEFSFIALRRFLRSGNIIHPGFSAWHVARIPVAVEQGAVCQLNYPLAGCARRDVIAVGHPVVILFLQLRQVVDISFAVIVGRQQIDHQAEERRL